MGLYLTGTSWGCGFQDVEQCSACTNRGQAGGCRAGAPRAGGPRAGGPRVGGPRAGGSREGGPKAGGLRAGAPRAAPRTGAPRAGGPRKGAPRSGAPRSGTPRADEPQSRVDLGAGSILAQHLCRAAKVCPPPPQLLGPALPSRHQPLCPGPTWS